MIFTLSLLAYLLRAALCGFFEVTNQAGSKGLVLSKEVFQCNMDKSCKIVAKQKDGTGFTFFKSEIGFGNGNHFDVVWKKMPEKSFIIRHVSGRCLGAKSINGQVVFQSSCNDRFIFTGNSHLKNVNSGFCMKPHGNDLYLTGSCDDPTTRYRYTAAKTFKIRHITGKCVGLRVSDYAIVFKSSCNESFIWTDNSCIQHVRTGLCMIADGNYNGAVVRLRDKCHDEFSRYKQNDKLSLENMATKKCFHPSNGGYIAPQDGLELVFHYGCNLDRLRFDLIWD